MRRRYHRLARIGAIAAGVAAAAFLFSRSPPRSAPRADVLTLRIRAVPLPAASFEPLFAEAAIDALPRRESGPPQLIGIVGRLSAPLAIIRLEDGAVRTIDRGAVAANWVLESVAADRATFRRGDERRVSVLPPQEAAQ